LAGCSCIIKPVIPSDVAIAGALASLGERVRGYHAMLPERIAVICPGRRVFLLSSA